MEAEPPVHSDPRFIPAPRDTLPRPRLVLEVPRFVQDLSVQKRMCLDPDPTMRLVTIIYPVDPDGQPVLPPVRQEPRDARRRDLLLRQRRGEPGRWDASPAGLSDWAALLANGQWLFGYDA